MGSSDSESEDERRVVRSAKDKATEELLSICNDIRNKMHINDWQSIQSLWDKLNKQLEKTQKVTGAIGTPRVFIKLIVELEDFLNKTLAGKTHFFILFLDKHKKWGKCCLFEGGFLL